MPMGKGMEMHRGMDMSKATMPAMGGGMDMTKCAQMPVKSDDHPLAMHSPPKARYSPKGTKGKAIVAKAFHEVKDDEMPPKQKVAVALSKARRRGVKIPKRY